ncbi:MAG TPA: MATE family efflux transporter [Spirochaetia bacterium]|nr:MATE family efflux transporter [Spirochaetia bacterium]
MKFPQHLSFVPGLLRLAMPIAAQALMMTVLNLVDTVMVGRLGEVEIAAIALGNQILFLLMLFLLGVGSGGAVFAAQYWGKGDVAGVRKALGVSLRVALTGALLFSTAAIAAPRLLLSAFTEDARVITVGIPYLRIVGSSYLFTAASATFAHSLRSIGDTRLPMYASILSISVNIVGNYVLIFGALGMPALGVTGAAISTAIARSLELGLILTIVYRRRGPIAASPAELLRRDPVFARRYLARSAPVIVNEVLWSLGFVMYALVFGRMGTAYLAAYNIADTVGRLMLVFFIGTGQASAVLIGNTIGRGEPAEAERIGRTLLRLVPAVSAAAGVFVFLVVAPLVPELFAIPESTRLLVRQFLRLFSVLLVAKAGNIHVIVGILRGGGDTRYSLAIDILPLWLLGVPLTVVAGLVLGLPAPLVYGCLMLEEGVRFLLGWARVHSGRWVTDVTSEQVAIINPPNG